MTDDLQPFVFFIRPANTCTILHMISHLIGVFDVQQVLYLLETQLEFATVLYRLSLADVTGWPFLCVSIGFTKVET